MTGLSGALGARGGGCVKGLEEFASERYRRRAKACTRRRANMNTLMSFLVIFAAVGVFGVFVQAQESNTENELVFRAVLPDLSCPGGEESVEGGSAKVCGRESFRGYEHYALLRPFSLTRNGGEELLTVSCPSPVHPDIKFGCRGGFSTPLYESNKLTVSIEVPPGGSIEFSQHVSFVTIHVVIASANLCETAEGPNYNLDILVDGQPLSSLGWEATINVLQYGEQQISEAIAPYKEFIVLNVQLTPEIEVDENSEETGSNLRITDKLTLSGVIDGDQICHSDIPYRWFAVGSTITATFMPDEFAPFRVEVPTYVPSCAYSGTNGEGHQTHICDRVGRPGETVNLVCVATDQGDGTVIDTCTASVEGENSQYEWSSSSPPEVTETS